MAAFDSQLKWCGGIRDELEAHGFDCRVMVPDTRSALSSSQIADAGFEVVQRVSWPRLVSAAMVSDVVVCALSGPMTQRLTIDVAVESARTASVGPVLVSGWVGIIIERITAGYLDRAGTDVVAVNSAHDLTYFRSAAATLGLPTDNLLLSGLPFLSCDPRPPRSSPITSVLYADQPTVPEDPTERLHVYGRLVALARSHPEWQVALKPRHRPGEDTFHRMTHHPADLLADENLPQNFRLDYTPVADALPDVDLLVTMSSTACLEAIDQGCRVALVLDLGVNERYGNHVFLDSGLLRTFEQMSTGDIGAPDADWLAGWFGGRDRPANQVIVDRVEELLASGDRPSRRAWDSAYFRSALQLSRARGDYRAPWMSAAWTRRVRSRGRLVGTATYGAALLTPPALAVPIRRLRQRSVRAR